jgi:hypothetical protein
LNLYTYCANNPLVYYDPSGHFWEELWEGTKGVGKKIGSDVVGLTVGTVKFAAEAAEGVVTLGSNTMEAAFNPILDLSVTGLHGVGIITNEEGYSRFKQKMAQDREELDEFFWQLPTNFVNSTKESFYKMGELPGNLIDTNKTWRDVADSTKATWHMGTLTYGGYKIGSAAKQAGTAAISSGAKGLSGFSKTAYDLVANESGYIKPGSTIKLNPWNEFQKATKGQFSTRAEAVVAYRASNKSAGSSKAVVIGEGMGDIKAIAKQLQAEGINAKWYQAWSKNFPNNRPMTPYELNAALAKNQRWIDSKIKQGYDIYDIGIDPLRNTRSPFYQLEQSRINNYGYPTIDITGRRP